MDISNLSFKIGSVGSSVKQLQLILNAVLGTELVVDGSYGPGTTEAVKLFQSAHSLVTDGVAGPKTCTALYGVYITEVKGYESVEDVASGDMVLDVARLARIMSIDASKAQTWLQPINKALLAFDINTPTRFCAFLANVCNETGSLTILRENLSYGAVRLADTWPSRFRAANGTPNQLALSLAGNPEALGNVIYAGRMGNGDIASGDGYKFRGGGGLQATGRSMYQQLTEDLKVDLINNPDLITHPDVAMMSAAAYWYAANINRYADVKDFDGVCDMVNVGHKTQKYGDAIGFARRLAVYKSAMALYGL